MAANKQRRVGHQLTEGEKEVLGMKAFEMSSRGLSTGEIAEKINVHRSTALKLMRQEIEILRRERVGNDREVAIGRYKAVINEAWDRLRSFPLNATTQNVTGCMNAIIQAQRSIDELTGAKAPVEWKGRMEHIDLSRFSDEELETWEELAERALVPAA